MYIIEGGYDKISVIEVGCVLELVCDYCSVLLKWEILGLHDLNNMYDINFCTILRCGHELFLQKLHNSTGLCFPYTGALAMETLHRQVLPFILRRLKEDVLQDLPPKIIQDYYCDLSSLQVLNRQEERPI